MNKKFFQTSAITLGLGLAIASTAEALTIDLGQDLANQIHEGSVGVGIRYKNDSVFADATNNITQQQHVEFKKAEKFSGSIKWEDMIKDFTWSVSITTTTGDFKTKHAQFTVSPSDLEGITGVDNESVNDVLNRLTLTLHDCKNIQDFKNLSCKITGSL